MKKVYVLSFVLSLLLISLPVWAETTVTVDNNNNKVTVNQNQPSGEPQQTVTQVPVVVTNVINTGAFEGRVVEVNYAQNLIVVQDSSGVNRQVLSKPEMINGYRVGDYVQVRPTADLTVITLEENPKDFEGEIIRVDIPKGQIIVLDTNGRERRVQLKQGMISAYTVDDYVRVHLMADLKEAKTIETVRDIRRLDGSIVTVDAQGSRMVVRDSHGNERTVLVRQGMITSYRVGNYVRVYQLADRDDVQLVRVIRIS
jgi:hypothetical protein